jgi:hypothetical protein
MVTIMAVLLAYTHLFAIIPLALMFLYLLWKYRIKSVKWLVATFVFSSPLLLLFEAMWKWRCEGRGLSTLNWYGATVNQLIIFAPLEWFSYTFVFWIPMIIYSTWIYRKMREITTIVAASAVTYGCLLSVADVTPVFIRYTLLFVPVWVTIGLLPVSDFIDNKEFSNAQKWFVVGSFSIFYFAIIAYGFISGLYQPKG